LKEGMNTLDTREKLIAAAKRIRSGCPVRIDPKRKFSPCAVEDEAGVSRSTIYGEKYSDLLVEYRNEKEKDKVQDIDYEKKYKEQKLKNKALRSVNQKLETEVRLLLQQNAELTQSLVCGRYNIFFSKVRSTDQ
jgi:hypothetical protein